MADDPKPQLDKFKDLARELGADEDEKAFEENVRKLAKAGVTPDDLLQVSREALSEASKDEGSD